ncbi:alanine racemase [candidate division WWE3 bacterium]|nr:alanine racemase [candidate division WWE3 bacterium]
MSFCCTSSFATAKMESQENVSGREHFAAPPKTTKQFPMNQPLNYIKISKENLLHNIAQLKKLTHNQKKVCAVVKANAYGHGSREVVEILNNHVSYFQVDDFLEFNEIKDTAKQPILVLGYVMPKNLEKLVEQGGIPAIYSLEQLKALETIAKRLDQAIKVHLKIDALLGRQGILLDDLPEFLRLLEKVPAIKIAGVYSHFSDADNGFTSHIECQIKTFKAAVKKIKQAGYDNFITHMSSTAGALQYGQNHNFLDMFRPGIGMYGLWPSPDMQEKYSEIVDFKPVLKWVSHIAQVKTVPKGYPISYNLTYITKKETKVAVIPQGYSDGYDRRLSNRGEVLIQGTRCPVLGRVAMNMIVVDVSHLEDVSPMDEVVLLGSQGGNEISADEIAEKIGTINYEVISRISPLFPRIVA